MKVKFGFGAVFVCCVALAACGSSDDGGSSGGGGGGGASTSSSGGSGGGVKVEGAKVIDPKSLENPPKGTIKYCQGKDTTGETKAWGKQFNEKYKSQGLSVKIVEFPASADEQRTQVVQRQQA
jgi:ABC-type glycerol-3-phosphate transport system substrate-binding protein